MSESGFDTWTLRHAITRLAKKLNCDEWVSGLTDMEAVRFLQQREGYTPCFGRIKPLRPMSHDPNRCDISECLWRGACENYRRKDVIPIDRELTNCGIVELEILKKRLLEYDQTKATLFSNNAIGMQFRSFTHSSAVIRKLLVSTPKTVFGESVAETEGLKSYILDNRPTHSYYTGSIHTSYKLVVLHTIDILSLQKIFSEAWMFFEKGDLAYYPLIQSIEYEVTGISKTSYPNENAPSTPQVHLPSTIQVSNFDAPHLGLPDGEIMLTDPDIAPILNIELPVLENIGYGVLNKLMSDFPNEMCSFRDFLRTKMEEMRTATVGSQEFAHDCRRLEREIREQIRKLDSDYKKAKLAAAFALTGCAIASWTLAFYCISQGANDVLTFLGPGGVAYTASAAYSDYLVKKLALKDNPVYFLWVLGKTKPRK